MNRLADLQRAGNFSTRRSAKELKHSLKPLATAAYSSPASGAEKRPPPISSTLAEASMIRQCASIVARPPFCLARRAPASRRRWLGMRRRQPTFVSSIEGLYFASRRP